MTKVYLLQHVHALDDGNEDVKMIGVYSSWESAKAALARLGHAPGFRDAPALIDPLEDDAPDGFYIDEYQLDEDHWAEGYVTETLA